MRIITGMWRGRKLKSPKDNQIRPTTDRVKESVFNILQPYIAESNVLDCFAGTGNLAFEALRWGADHAVLIEQSVEAKKIITENCEILQAQDVIEIMQGEFFSVLKRLQISKYNFDLIFIDPPYGKGLQLRVIEALSESSIINEDTIFVVEHKTEVDMPEDVGRLLRKRNKVYGSITVSFYVVQK